MAPRATDGVRVKAQLAKARATLETAGIPLPWLDAEILVAHVLRSSRERLHSHPERELTVAQRAQLRRLTSRRVARVPVPYLVGEREFYGYMFRVTPAVLIPRPSSELLVELAIDWLTAHPEARRMIDLGTGSGAVAISVAKAVPQVQIEARDLSARALKVADENIARYRLRRRITTVKADLLRRASPADLILANLPYIPEALRRIRPKELEYEPALALDGGKDGLSLIRVALAQAPAVLKPGGLVLFECDPAQTRRIVRLAQGHWPTAQVTVHKDLAGQDRVVRIQT
ncbi:MAG TPA: peptide chain release factor N(5)-glutamine methyltransferase [Candidatus Dormibacteraeota bacterium]|jgi:release factor glutamine methyltransferase|nr:peptide chain release factor N(5)-glutamine methyltransferase [Candidatus Dormibacteraeota bacterium]